MTIESEDAAKPKFVVLFMKEAAKYAAVECLIGETFDNPGLAKYSESPHGVGCILSKPVRLIEVGDQQGRIGTKYIATTLLTNSPTVPILRSSYQYYRFLEEDNKSDARIISEVKAQRDKLRVQEAGLHIPEDRPHYQQDS
jgi:hypothetical protein